MSTLSETGEPLANLDDAKEAMREQILKMLEENPALKSKLLAEFRGSQDIARQWIESGLKQKATELSEVAAEAATIEQYREFLNSELARFADETMIPLVQSMPAEVMQDLDEGELADVLSTFFAEL